MRVVVTGATGNVGTSLVAALSRDEDVSEIVGVARRAPTMRLPKVRWRQADVASSALDPLLRGADAVVHLAWLIQPSRDERLTRRVNVEGSDRVFEAVARAGVPTLVYTSSPGAYTSGAPKEARVDDAAAQRDRGRARAAGGDAYGRRSRHADARAREQRTADGPLRRT